MPWKITPYDEVKDGNGFLEFYGGPFTGTSRVYVHNYESIKGFRCHSTKAERLAGIQQPHLREHLRYKSTPVFGKSIVNYDVNGDPIYGTKAIVLESEFANRRFMDGGSLAEWLSDFESARTEKLRAIENAMVYRSRGVEADMLVTIGEAVQTRKLLASAGQGLADVLKRVKAPDNASIIDKVMIRMRRRGYDTHWNDKIQKMFFRECQKEIASAWLIYRYAIMPLCYSIRDFTGAWIKQQSESLMEGRPIGADGNIEGWSRTAYVDASHLKDVFGSERAVITFDASFRCHWSAWLQADQLERFGVDSLNQYVRAAWELTPHSFWIDWCCDIMGLIDSLVPPDFPIRNCGLTQVMERKVTISYASGSHTWELKQKERTLRIPDPTWAPQSPIAAIWGESGNKKRIADTLSLIRQFRH